MQEQKITLTMPQELVEELERQAQIEDRPKARIIKQAVREYLERAKAKA